MQSPPRSPVMRERIASWASSAGKEEKQRENWSGQFDFLLSCIGYAVGLGTIWRFPYLCYRNGGGAFLIPYLIYLMFLGIPLVVLEMAYGQYSSLSPITVWKMCPLFQGIGYGMVIISGIVCVYYNVIIAWTLYYLVMSFRSKLPWSHCKNDWNTNNCVDPFEDQNQTLGMTATITTTTEALLREMTNETGQKKTPSEEFWERNVLGMSDGIEHMGAPRWQLTLALFIAWVLIGVCLFKGIKSSGKVVYVTATLPYVLLFIFFIRGITLPGALTGIQYYLVPDMSKLLSFQTWGDAAMQLFYSTGAAWGALITMASYNKFHNNFYSDALIVACMDTFTAFSSGLVIFCIIGFMAVSTGVDVSDVVTQGPGLVFVVYPAAIAQMPIAPMWAVLFFLFLLTVGIDSQFGMFETVLSAVFDEYPNLRHHKTIITVVLCVVEFLFGLPCVTHGGIYFLQIMDWYCSTFSLMVLSLTECLVITYIYGIDKFYRDIHLMLGFPLCCWFKFMWGIVTPALTAFILVLSMATHTPVTYGSYSYPRWGIAIGWIFAICSMLPLPVVAIVRMCREKGGGGINAKFQRLLRPTYDWGPADFQKQRRSIHKAKVMPAVAHTENGKEDAQNSIL